MTWQQIHPALNACLNLTSALLLAYGFVLIRRGERAGHQRAMVAAFATSAIFLASYLARFAMTGTHRYPAAGASKAVYLFVLFSHMVLAVAVLPLIFRAFYLARKGEFAAHKRVVKWAWPIWMYVSVTGVVVYVMLYHLGPALAAR